MTLIKRATRLLFLAMAWTIAGPAIASAAVFTLSVADPNSGLGNGPFGTVTVTESAGSLIFVETLKSDIKLNDGASDHNALAFNLAGDPAVSFSNITAGFDAVFASAVSAPPFGTFNNAFHCTTSCGQGFAGGFAGPLTFTVSASSGMLSLASLTFNTVGADQVYFASDLVNSTGSEGNVGAVAAISAVLEPATWAMFISGFGAIGFSLRRNRSVVVRSC